MSDYTQSTFFAPKDLLATGNPNKIIYGSDVDAELSAISTAIATKADVNGDAIGAGTPCTELSVDNLKLDANKIISTNTDGDIELEPDGTGIVTISSSVGIGTASPATALDVTGTVTADGIVTDTTNGFKINTAAEVEASWTHTAGTGSSVINVGRNSTWGGDLTIQTDTKNRLNIESSGDISFYEDTGTTPKFFWDASAESLGIGTSSPFTPLQVDGASGNLVGVFETTTGNTNRLYLGAESGASFVDATAGVGSTSLVFKVASTERARIDSSGNALIGTTTAAGSLSNTARVTGGIFSTNNGTTSVPNATWTTLATIPTGDGIYLVTAYLPTSGDPANYNAVSIVTTSLTGTNLVDIKNAPTVDLRMSGSSFQVNHGQGTTQPINWSILRLA